MNITELKKLIAKTNAVVGWSEVTLQATRESKFGPTATARNLFMVHGAMYNVWTIFDKKATHEGQAFAPKTTGGNDQKVVAISGAAYRMISKLFPDYCGTLESVRKAIVPDALLEANQSFWNKGLAAADVLHFQRLTDGSNEAAKYAEVTSNRYPSIYAPVNHHSIPQNSPAYNPNRWQPLQPAGLLPQNPLTQHWGNVSPFAVTDVVALRPAPPPRLGSAVQYTDGKGKVSSSNDAFISQMEEVITVSSQLVDKEKVIAEYWADGPRTETPPGHWFTFAQDLIHRDGLGVDKTVKLLFALGAGVLDSSICCWEAKRAYDSPRPQSAIRNLKWGQRIMAWGGPNKGTVSMKGEKWMPYQPASFPTPPFQEFTSGHSTFSNCSASILTELLGDGTFYDGFSRGVRDDTKDGWPDFIGQVVVKKGSSTFESNTPCKDVVLEWATLEDAAEEAGMSRLYGGIHIQDGNLRGAEMGKAIATLVLAKAKKLWGGSF
jgi:hypothetical protein